MQMLRWFTFFLTATASAFSGSEPPAGSQCGAPLKDVDINPHTPGLGSAPGSSIERCCALCSSSTWWARGCRFSTLSRGLCWFKANNQSVVASPGKWSVESTAQAAPPPGPPPATHRPWTSIGPWNIGDDVYGHGEAGTIAPAVSPAANPNVMYMGGNNNAASSGVLKSVDRGQHWLKVNVGLLDTRLHGLIIVDDMGEHVLAGTPSGVFETLDGAKTWTHVKQTQAWGVANSFKNGTIGGKPYVLLGTSAGLGNVPLLPGQPLVNETWSLIRSPPGHSAWRTNPVSVADFRHGKPLANSVVGGCIWPDHSHGVVHVGTILNTTAASWMFQLDQPCLLMAMDPNDADHLLVQNSSNGAHTYESNDGGKTYHGCLDHRGSILVAIDRQGWFYTGAEPGAFRNHKGCGPDGKWEPYFVRRVWRRMNRTVDRVPHDYQRISIDFAGGVAFGSDQGMFIKNGSELQLISANGDVNNNVIMHPAIAEGEEPNETCITTAIWDWSPIASWDSGKHWPSWQTPDDGAGMGYFGEGGGCFGVGKSKHVLCMHHHNVAHSSRCGKNMSRLVVPHGASVAGPEFSRKRGSRSEPSGMVYAPMVMGMPPWTALPDKAVECTGAADLGDIGVHSNYSCLSHADLGLQYRWWSGVTAIVWRGDTDKHCHLCKLAGNASSWKLTDAKGATVYALVHSEQGDGDGDDEDKDGGWDDDEGDDDEDDGGKKDDDDDDEDGQDDDDEGGDEGEGEGKDAYMAHVRRHVEKTRALEWDLPGAGAPPQSGLDLSASASPWWVLKSWNFGANWTWILLPPELQGCHFRADPTDDTTLYAVTASCIGRSYDQAETWSCWEAPGLTGSFKDLQIKDSRTMIVMRNRDVPLRTRDGGGSWERLESVQPIAGRSPSAKYSWSGKTLALSAVIGTTVVWVSKDDGDTWVDESGDYTADNGGIAQWYENTLYVSSMGQGISSKTFAE